MHVDLFTVTRGKVLLRSAVINYVKYGVRAEGDCIGVYDKKGANLVSRISMDRKKRSRSDDKRARPRAELAIVERVSESKRANRIGTYEKYATREKALKKNEKRKALLGR